MIDFSQPLIWTVPDVLGPDVCGALIERIEAGAPTLATINAPHGVITNTNIRNNTRVIFDDPELAADLFARIRAHVPERLLGLDVCGCNERFRCYKYEPGQQFRLHMDGSFVRHERERSLLTFMIYLNEDFEGGETDFPEAEETIVPRTGAALLFQHPVSHEGCAVTRGIKYVVRSDVMYRQPT